MKKSIFFSLACLLVCVPAIADSSDLREWRTSDGKQAVRAEAIDAKYDRESKTTLVYFKKSDGAISTIPFPKLDEGSREHAWYNVQHQRAQVKNRPSLLSPPGTVKFPEKLLAPVDAENVPDTMTKNGGNALLGIAPRIHELGRPPEGWCGEEAIQEGLGYYGIYYPQEKINEAGHPVHPDLYSNDIPLAIKNLGMLYQPWPADSTDAGDFITWVRKQISGGSPVLVGVKIYPTQHEEWGLDHFVLAVGVEGDALVLNTTWGFRYTLSEQQLRSTHEGFSFANKYQSYYGLSLKGPRPSDRDARPVRLFVKQETAERLDVIVKCEDLEAGAEYSLYRLSLSDEKNPKPLLTFQAKQPVYAVEDVIERAKPAIYRCLKVSSKQ